MNRRRPTAAQSARPLIALVILSGLLMLALVLAMSGPRSPKHNAPYHGHGRALHATSL